MTHDDTLGIVLAAGEATRMPNKLLLPIADDLLVVESSLRFMLAANVKRVVVVVKALDDHVPLVLRSLRNWDTACGVEYVRQEKPGVLSAIASGLEHVGSYGKQVVVAFGDNVYDAESDADALSYALMPDDDKIMPLATARNFVDRESQIGLDYWTDQDQLWRSRDYPRSEYPKYFLTGWLSGRQTDFKTMCRAYQNSLIDGLNIAGFKPLKMANNSWHDVGTPSGYERYLNSVSQRKDEHDCKGT